MYIALTAILKESSNKLFNKKFWLLEEKGNTHALLSFVSSTNELKNYSNKPFKRKSFQRL